MTRTVLIIAALLLAGCNFVYSKDPLVTDLYVAKTAKVQLRPGVWRVLDPGCAKGGDCQPPTIRFDAKGRGEAWDEESTYKLVFGQGEPGLVQAKLPKGKPSYVYFGARPTKFGPGGEVTAMKVWKVQCGPLTHPDTLQGAEMTKKPYPGLKMQDGVCQAQDVAAVRAAARTSETMDPVTIAWADVR